MTKNRIVYTLILLMICSFGTNTYAQTFEGEIHMNIDKIKTSGDVVNEGKAIIYVSGKKMGIEVLHMAEGEMPGNVYLDYDKNELQLAMDKGGQKMGFKVNLDMLGQYSSMMLPPQSTNQTEKANINVTGKKKMIGNVSCFQVTFDDSKSKGEGWFTNDLGLSINDLIPENMPSMGVDIPSDLKGFPILITSTEKKTGKTYKAEFTPKKTSVSQSKVTMPSDITVMDLGQMLMMAKDNPEMLQNLLGGFGGQ